MKCLDETSLNKLITLTKTGIKEVSDAAATAAAAKADKPKACLVTLGASGWDASGKTQSVTVNGIVGDEASQMVMAMPAAASLAEYEDCDVQCIGPSGDGTLTFQCGTVPAAALKVWVTWEDVEDVTPPIP